jgi:hypothetical protein
MNPYQQLVTQQAMQEMRRQADIARAGAAAQAVRSGAFGGTREGVQRAETERGVQDVMSQRILQDYAQNYGQAQQAAVGTFEQQQQRQLAASQGLGQMGSQQAAIEAQRAQLGLTGAGQLASIGSTLRPARLAAGAVRAVWRTVNRQSWRPTSADGTLAWSDCCTTGAISGRGAQLYGQLGQGIGSLAAQEAGLGLQQGAALGQLGTSIGQLACNKAPWVKLRRACRWQTSAHSRNSVVCSNKTSRHVWKPSALHAYKKPWHHTNNLVLCRTSTAARRPRSLRSRQLQRPL